MDEHNMELLDDMTLKEIAEKAAQTYSLEQILEIADMTDEDIIYLLLINGLLDPDIPVEL